MIFAFVFCFCVPASATEAQNAALVFLTDIKEARPGEVIRLAVNAGGLPSPAGFCLSVEYDTGRFVFERTENSAQVQGNLVTNGAENPVRSAYVCGISGTAAPTLSGTVITYVFRVREQATPGTAGFRIDAGQFCDFAGNPMEYGLEQTCTVQVLPAPSSQAFLTALEPAVGKLVPAFSRNIYHYTLEVEANVDDLTFSAEAGEDGRAAVNRHKLNRAGQSTEITITAVSQDGKTKAPYIVTVNRLDKEEVQRQSPLLNFLMPSAGILEPAFSGDVTDYALRVGSEVADVTFSARAAEGAGITVSRHKLNKAGEETKITIAAVSPDGKSRRVYTVMVYRSPEKVSLEKPAPGPLENASGAESDITGEEYVPETAASGAGAAGAEGRSPPEPLMVRQNGLTAFFAGLLSAGFLTAASVLLLRRKRDVKNNKESAAPEKPSGKPPEK